MGGNYKGVMLCNRPFAGVAAAAKTSAKATPSFLTGTPMDKIGANVPIMKDKVVARRSKKETALSRHKKWLVDLQKTKDLLESEMMAEQDEKDEKRRKFMERERKMRAAVRGVDPAEAKGGSDGGYDSKYAKDEDDYDDYDDVGDAPPKAGKKEPKKPMWAMTEGKASKAVDEQEEDEAEELLDFAAGLDFDKFIDDMEVRAMMEQVKGRVDELETAIAEDERIADNLDSRAEERAAELTEENLEDYEYDDDEQRKDDDLMSVAESLLSERGGLNQKYSKQAMLEKIAQVKNSQMEPIAEEKDSIVEANKRMIADMSKKNADNKQKKAAEEKEARLRAAEAKQVASESVDASNLPYLHRNPAV